MQPVHKSTKAINWAPFIFRYAAGIRPNEQFLWSNLERSSRYGRSQDFLLHSSAPMKQSSGVALWPMTRRARTRSILHQMLNGFLLRDLDDESNRFCSLTAAATIHRRMTTRRRLGRPLTAVWVAPGGDPTRETTPTATVWVGYPAPGVESRRGASARWIDGGGLLGGGGSVGAKSAQERRYL
jgi:hypothetical protein